MLYIRRYLVKFGGILKLVSGVDIDNLLQYTVISSLLNRLDTNITSILFWAKTRAF